MEVNIRLKRLRRQRGFTLLELANKLGVSEATVQRYESGEIRNLKSDTIVRLAEILRCSPAHLMGWDDVPTAVQSTKALPIVGRVKYKNNFVCVNQVASGRFNPINDTHAEVCLEVTDDSLVDLHVFAGDKLFIKKQNVSLSEGHVYIVHIHDLDLLAVKRCYSHESQVVLAPCCHRSPLLVRNLDGVTLVGECVGVYKLLD